METKTFHIVWMVTEELSKGQNYQAINMGQAYLLFFAEHEVEPLYIWELTKK